ncbi:hypothetical protein GDO86_014448 [Hymenochirus boettgeri]|uniref:IRS-type PTB domain-containing protein n=1 Tax=Hymenochirus boettgeri TaxID=247094 RepID=A0A8T2JNY4_9PIPI|nr:hypothetical protein GDO86_014448 [Hymenochirus boettgeri]
MFSFEAGRRCTSGPGNFTFETSQGHEIFQRVESSIRAQQGPENQLPALDIDSTVESVSGSNVPPGKDTEEKVLKGRTLPNIPVPKPATPLNLLEPSAVSSNSSTPPRSPLAHCASRSVGVDSDHLIGVYSEPKDSVKRMNPQFDSLYSDPVDCVAGNVMKGQRSQTEPSVTSPLYSDIYEHVGYETVGGAVPPILKNRPAPLSPGEEHIYDEPEGMAQRAEPPQVYSEVQMEVGSWKRHAADEKLGYEFPYNPNTDDYSVPNSQGQWSQPRNRGIGPKPVPAPKPQGIVISKAAGKEVDLLNSNNNNSSEVIYSQVQKKEGARGKGPKFQMEPPEPAASPSIPLMPHAAKPQTVPLFLQSASVLSVPSLPLPPVPPVPLPNKPPQTLSLITKPLTASPVSTPVKSQNAPPHRWPVPPNKITSASALANPPNVPASIQLHQLLGTSDDEELSSSEGTQMSTIYEDMGVL